MDTLNTPTIRKKLRRLSAQDPGESRNRWQHVTEALRRQDIDAATEAKHVVSCHSSLHNYKLPLSITTEWSLQLEEQQRDDARERQRLGVEWQQKVGVWKKHCCLGVKELHGALCTIHTHSCSTRRVRPGYTILHCHRDSQSWTHYRLVYIVHYFYFLVCMYLKAIIIFYATSKQSHAPADAGLHHIAKS